MWMFYGKFADEGNHLVDNPNIYNVEGDNMLSPGLPPITTESVFKIVQLPVWTEKLSSESGMKTCKFIYN